MTEDLRDLASREWFGYGRWGAPYWFVGLQPGGADYPELYTAWNACGRGSLIDAPQHEEEWNKLVPPGKQMHHFAPKPKIQTGTWQPLIQIVLGFAGSNEDAHVYQRDRLGRSSGETALIELRSTASVRLSKYTTQEKADEAERIAYIHDQLTERPDTKFVVFYGKSCERQFSEIAGGPFDAEGFRWFGSTLCALINHPARPTMTYAYWRAFGEKMRSMVNQRAQRSEANDRL